MSGDIPQNLKRPDLPAVDSARVQEFILRWQNTEGSGAELADFQSFLVELCELLEVPKPDPKSDATKDNGYIFERPVESFSAVGERKNSKNRIDLYRRNCFVMEGKQTGKKVGSQAWNSAMQNAKNQADNYVRSLSTDEGRPPFIVVVDVGSSIQLYSEFSRSGGIYVPFPDPGHYLIALGDIAKPEVQQRLQMLWLAPDALDSSKYAARVTREVSLKLAELAKSLEQSGFDVERTAHFLKRCLFTMFSEDVNLIPEGSFTALLEGLIDEPEHFSDSMRTLWTTMNTGGFEGQVREVLPRFNGGLFSDIDPIPLNTAQIELLIDAARADWRYVEPAIFGTLLERALDPRERHKLGAHFTPRAYVERLVIPTIIEPLRAEWETVKVSVEMLLQKGKEKKAVDVLRDFHFHLCEIRVLDPACGSANFLYVALEHLKRLEGEVLNLITDLSDGQVSMDTQGLTVDPHQFLGIEINPRAAAIAEIVLWIGFLQWHYRLNGKLQLPEPILRDFKNIENRDALLEYDSREPMMDEQNGPMTIWDRIGYKLSPITDELIPDETQRIPVYKYLNPVKAEWPKADYIIGNPPFIGAATMRRALGDGYVDAVRKIYKGSVPDSADLVMYWWHLAAEKVSRGEAKQFGLITTNSVRQTFNRRVLELYLDDSAKPLSLVFAIPDHPWVDGNDGAAVRIAMTVCVGHEQRGLLQQVISEIPGEQDVRIIELVNKKGKIFSDLKIGANVTSSSPLAANGNISSKGFEPGNSGFLVSQEQSMELDPNCQSNSSNVIHPYLNGRDLISKPKGMWLIDCFGYSEQELREEYPIVYQWLLETVKPQREQNRDRRLQENWWLHRRSRSDFRLMVQDLDKFITTVETSKHRFFTMLDKTVAPSNLLVNICVNDQVLFGILSSRVHILWALSVGGRLGVGNDPRYNKSRCFETFPFPALDSTLQDHIGDLAVSIDLHRKRSQEEFPNLTLTNMYNVLEKLRSNAVLSEKEREINQQGLVGVLGELHDSLDRAAFAAYGWEDLGDILVGMPGATTPLPDKSYEQAEVEEELLMRLVELNESRAEEETHGYIRWLRPDFQSPAARQVDFELGEEVPIVKLDKKDVRKKITWPRELRDQIKLLLNILETPATAVELAGVFKRKPIKQVESVLVALETLGRAEKIKEVWSLT